MSGRAALDKKAKTERMYSSQILSQAVQHYLQYLHGRSRRAALDRVASHASVTPALSKEHILLQSPSNTLNIWEHVCDGPFCQRQLAGALPMPKVPRCLH